MISYYLMVINMLHLIQSDENKMRGQALTHGGDRLICID